MARKKNKKAGGSKTPTAASSPRVEIPTTPRTPKTEEEETRLKETLNDCIKRLQEKCQEVKSLKETIEEFEKEKDTVKVAGSEEKLERVEELEKELENKEKEVKRLSQLVDESKDHLKQIESLKKDNVDQQNELEKSKEEVLTLTGTLAETNKKLEELENEMSNQKNELEEKFSEESKLNLERISELENELKVKTDENDQSLKESKVLIERVSELEKEVQNQQENNKSLKKSLDESKEYREYIKNLEKENEELSHTISDHERDLKAIRNELSQSIAESKRISGDNDTLNEKNSSLLEEINDLKKNVQETSGSVDNEETEFLKKQIDELKGECDVMRSQLMEASEMGTSVVNEKEVLEQEFHKLTVQFEDANSHIAELEHVLHDSQIENETSLKKMTAFKKELTEAHDELDVLRKNVEECENLRSDVARLKAETQSFETKHSSMIEQLEKAERENEEKTEDIEELRITLQEASSTNKELENKYDAIVAELESKTQELESQTEMGSEAGKKEVESAKIVAELQTNIDELTKKLQEKQDNLISREAELMDGIDELKEQLMNASAVEDGLRQELTEQVELNNSLEQDTNEVQTKLEDACTQRDDAQSRVTAVQGELRKAKDLMDQIKAEYESEMKAQRKRESKQREEEEKKKLKAEAFQKMKTVAQAGRKSILTEKDLIAQQLEENIADLRKELSEVKARNIEILESKDLERDELKEHVEELKAKVLSEVQTNSENQTVIVSKDQEITDLMNQLEKFSIEEDSNADEQVKIKAQLVEMEKDIASKERELDAMKQLLALELEQTKNQLEERNGRVDILENQVYEYEKENETLRGDLDSLRADNESIQQKISYAEEQVELHKNMLSSEREDKKETVKANEEQILTLGNELEDLKTAMTDEVERLREELEKQNHDKKMGENKASDLQRELSSRVEETEKIHSELISQIEKIKDESARVEAQLREDVKQAVERYEQSKKEAELLTTVTEEFMKEQQAERDLAAENNNKAIEEQANEYEKQLEDLNTELKDVQNKLALTINNLKDQEAVSKEQKNVIDEKQTEIDDHKNKIEELSETLKKRSQGAMAPTASSMNKKKPIGSAVGGVNEKKRTGLKPPQSRRSLGATPQRRTAQSQSDVSDLSSVGSTDTAPKRLSRPPATNHLQVQRKLRGQIDRLNQRIRVLTENLTEKEQAASETSKKNRSLRLQFSKYQDLLSRSHKQIFKYKNRTQELEAKLDDMKVLQEKHDVEESSNVHVNEMKHLKERIRYLQKQLQSSNNKVQSLLKQQKDLNEENQDLKENQGAAWISSKSPLLQKMLTSSASPSPLKLSTLENALTGSNFSDVPMSLSALGDSVAIDNQQKSDEAKELLKTVGAELHRIKEKYMITSAENAALKAQIRMENRIHGRRSETNTLPNFVVAPMPGTTVDGISDKSDTMLQSIVEPKEIKSEGYTTEAKSEVSPEDLDIWKQELVNAKKAIKPEASIDVESLQDPKDIIAAVDSLTASENPTAFSPTINNASEPITKEGLTKMHSIQQTLQKLLNYSSNLVHTANVICLEVNPMSEGAMLPIGELEEISREAERTMVSTLKSVLNVLIGEKGSYFCFVFCSSDVCSLHNAVV
eukprot:TRINITY_DN1386_c0_g1_i1.p1 TRINITY_DN1386_c0_g1~~TRINITY_DN1386_c0_g1_i1.p1  ORF type:complete len:1610 (+),score=657.57 TRINITY_DN1386_c0_g1_i1:173-5002(+)